MPDYSNTIIYKISCKDPTVSGVYVGHTTDFTKRKYSHMNSSLDTNNMVLLYRTIRFYGGWDNWEMKIVGFFDCKNLTEAREKEQEFYLSLHANLNSVEPVPTQKNKTNTNNFIVKKEVYEHATAVEDTRHELVKEVTETVVNKYLCKICDLNCHDKTKYERHIQTNKHNNNKLYEDVSGASKHVCLCGKKYNHRQGLFVHKKTCQVGSVAYLTQLAVELVKSNSQMIESQHKLHQQVLTFITQLT